LERLFLLRNPCGLPRGRFSLSGQSILVGAFGLPRGRFSGGSRRLEDVIEPRFSVGETSFSQTHQSVGRGGISIVILHFLFFRVPCWSASTARNSRLPSRISLLLASRSDISYLSKRATDRPGVESTLSRSSSLPIA
jgi:hypothetical protein